MSHEFYNYKQLKSKNRFKRGDMVLFNPPPGAYSPKSRQAQCAGGKGVIIAMHSDEYGILLFQNVTCFCNLKYCEKS